MSQDISEIRNFYDSDPHKEDRRLREHQLEYDLTWRFLERYLPAGGEVLEAGAATGRYTLELARRGYKVTAVDLSAAQLAVGRRRAAEAGLAGRVKCVVADVRDLRGIAGREYDAVLLMGPLYHLVEEKDRRRALREAFRRMRGGAVIFSAFISRLGIMGDLIRAVPEWVEEREAVRSHLSRGRRPDDAPRGGFHGYFARASEVAPLHEAVGFETVAVAGVEPGISADDESYNRLEGERRRLWLDLFEEICIEPSTIGASRHLLYVGRKR